MNSDYTVVIMEPAKDRILEASLGLFSARGYQAVSTKAIAEASGVNEVTIFRLFGSKRGLFVGVYERFFINLGTAIASLRLARELEPDLVTFGAAFTTFFINNNKIVAMSIKDIRDEFPEIDRNLMGQVSVLAGAVSSYLGGMAGIGLASGDTDRLARLFADCLFGLAVHRAKHDEMEGLPEAVEDLARVFARGIGVRP
jgi:AcrR family transcriptional regulator